MILGKPAPEEPEDHGKPAHGDHGPGCETAEITGRRSPIGKGQGRQHSQEMGAPSQPMQGPDPEGRVRMPRAGRMGCFDRMRMVRSVKVEVFMLLLSAQAVVL